VKPIFLPDSSLRGLPFRYPIFLERLFLLWFRKGNPLMLGFFFRDPERPPWEIGLLTLRVVSLLRPSVCFVLCNKCLGMVICTPTEPTPLCPIATGASLYLPAHFFLVVVSCQTILAPSQSGDIYLVVFLAYFKSEGLENIALSNEGAPFLIFARNEEGERQEFRLWFDVKYCFAVILLEVSE